jgi:hypothetical protein
MLPVRHACEHVLLNMGFTERAPQNALKLDLYLVRHTLLTTLALDSRM